MSFTAKIPKRVLLYKEAKVGNIQKWQDLPDNHILNKTKPGKKSILQPVETFCVTDSKLKLYKKKGQVTDIFEVIDNKPMKIELVGYSHDSNKSNKQSEIQVKFLNKFVTSISNDVFIHSLLKDGLPSNGKIPGEFYFATINRKTKLIKKDSELEEIIQEHIKEKDKNSIPINPKEFEVGKIYKNRSGKAAVFLGFVTTETMTYTTKFRNKSIKLKEQVKATQRTSSRSLNTTTKRGPSVKFHPSKFATLWFQITPIWNYSRGTSNLIPENKKHLEGHLLEKCSQKNFYALSLFSVKKKHSFVKEVHNIKIDVPDDIVFRIRRLANNNIGKSSQSYLIEIVRASRYAGLANMSLFGTGIHRSPYYKRFSNFENQ